MGSIWCVKFLPGSRRSPQGKTFVSQSAPAIARANNMKTVAAIYRANGTRTRCYRCKNADDLNEALEGEDAATFIVSNSKCWIIARDEIKNATVDSGATDG